MPPAPASSCLNYAAVFEESVLGVKCDVEVVLDVSARTASVTAGMRQPLRSAPLCRVSIDTLQALSRCIREAKAHEKMLDQLVQGSTDHQFNSSDGGATLIIVKPTGKPARYTLTIGLFHREGLMQELSATDVDAAVTKLEALRARVLAKWS